MKIIKEKNNFLYLKQDKIRRSIISNDKIYFLSFPEMIFRIEYSLRNSYEVNFITGFIYLNGKYFNMPLYNISLTGNLCIGNWKPFNSLEEMKIFFEFNFWSRSFADCNFSKSMHMYQDRQKLMSNLRLWEEKTKEDKNWVPSEEDLIEFNRENNYSCFHNLMKDCFENDN